MNHSSLDKNDVAVILRMLEHYKNKLETQKDKVQEINYSGIFLEDLDIAVNSTVNLLSRLKGVEALEKSQMSAEEETLVARSLELFIGDTSSLQSHLKRELGKANIDTPLLEKHLTIAKNLREKLRVEK